MIPNLCDHKHPVIYNFRHRKRKLNFKEVSFKDNPVRFFFQISPIQLFNIDIIFSNFTRHLYGTKSHLW